MPDLERLNRSLEQHLAQTPEQKAYIRGKHAGEDAARWQVARIMAAAAILVVAALHYAG